SQASLHSRMLLQATRATKTTADVYSTHAKENNRNLSNVVYCARSPGARSRDDRARIAKSARNFQRCGLYHIYFGQHAFRFHAARMAVAFGRGAFRARGRA